MNFGIFGYKPDTGGESIIAPVVESYSDVLRRFDEASSRDEALSSKLKILKSELDKYRSPYFTTTCREILEPELLRLQTEIADKLDANECKRNLDRITGQRNEIKRLLSRASVIEDEIALLESQRYTLSQEIKTIKLALTQKQQGS